jgi:cold shock CspA family protein/uncharacterized Zn-finger protein
MEGKVKWFSVDKGYGFITGTDGVDRYFTVQDVFGSELPANGDLVRFEEKDGKKGPRAININITTRAITTSDAQKTDERVICPHCNKKMVPRIITSNGALDKSVCPFCGETYKDFSQCFIASAVYGDPSLPQIDALRRFRDNTLRQNFLGRFFIKIYYHLSPPLAKAISHRQYLRRYIRIFLDFLVRRYGL